MKPVKIALLGLGTVGCGTVNVLRRNAKEIQRRAGREIEITMAAVKNRNKKRDCDLNGIEITTDAFAVVNNPDVDVVLELIGGETEAKELVMAAIRNGKHVITANKALIASHGNEIFAAAREQGVMVAFEAAVAGGIPIIKAIREGLAGNRIQWIAGIINGTSNYILSEMLAKGRDFNDALADAQALGYAEADPTFDIEGIDVAHKLTILASIAFGVSLQLESVYTEGISHITQVDIQYAKELGYTIKHLGITKRHTDGVELRVHPTLIPDNQTIAHVNGAMNALLVEGDAVGPTLYYGAGAGAEPTASSVIGDLVDVVRTLTSAPGNRVPYLAFQPRAMQELASYPMDKVKTCYYLRMLASDKPGVLADITRILGDREISIESIIQKESEYANGMVPIIILTHRVPEKNMNQAIHAIENLNTIENKVTRIRMEQLND